MRVPDAIGGYFGLELQPKDGPLRPAALSYQSARAAYLALLRAGRPNRVWMPWFICDSMMEPLQACGVPVVRYGLTESWAVGAEVTLQPNDWLLYVNYFGLNDAMVDDVLHRFPGRQVVIDNAQGFYAKPPACLATIYSPRKFFGVPDGGYLLTELPLVEPDDVDDRSAYRCSHLVVRRALGAERGYQDFIAAERSLAMQEPKTMSQLTADLLATIDYEAVLDRRRENFLKLHDALSESNKLPLRLRGRAGPLCYPYLVDEPGLRAKLTAERIYVATYWPEVVRSEYGVPLLERSLTHGLLPLPCDQRYAEADMDRIIQTIERARGSR